LGVYSIRTFRQDKTVYVSEMRDHKIQVNMGYKPGEAAPNPLETLLSALSSCKLVNFWDLAGKYKISFEDADIEVTAVVGPFGVVEGTHQPRNNVKSIHSTWRIKTDMTDDAIEKYLKIVDGTCTVSLSMDPAIEFTDEIIRL